MRPSRRALFLLALGLILTGTLGPPTASAAAGTLPAGFRESTVLSGMSAPTNLEFAADGRVFVAEKGGRIHVFDGVSDSTPTLFADLRPVVQNYWDRGLLG